MKTIGYAALLAIAIYIAAFLLRAGPLLGVLSHWGTP
jgi:hypothetical protein